MSVAELLTSDGAVRVMLTVNVGALLALAGFGWRLARFVAQVELKVDVLWSHYVGRKERR